MSFKNSVWRLGRLRNSSRSCHRNPSIEQRSSGTSVHNSPEISRVTQAPLAECSRLIEELNTHIAMLRDLLINVGKHLDGSEMRDRIKHLRRKCIELCSATTSILLPEIRNDVAEGIPVDSQQLVNLVCCTQLLVRELHKCKQLIVANPMDMTDFYEHKYSNVGGMAVLDMLVLWRPSRDYHQEELSNIDRDIESASAILIDMQEFMPQETNASRSLVGEEAFVQWSQGRKRAFYNHLGDLCCLCKTKLS